MAEGEIELLGRSKQVVDVKGPPVSMSFVSLGEKGFSGSSDVSCVAEQRISVMPRSLPWLTGMSDSFLPPMTSLLEYGSGGSTLVSALIVPLLVAGLRLPLEEIN